MTGADVKWWFRRKWQWMRRGFQPLPPLTVTIEFDMSGFEEAMGSLPTAEQATDRLSRAMADVMAADIFDREEIDRRVGVVLDAALQDLDEQRSTPR